MSRLCFRELCRVRLSASQLSSSRLCRTRLLGRQNNKAQARTDEWHSDSASPQSGGSPEHLERVLRAAGLRAVDLHQVPQGQRGLRVHLGPGGAVALEASQGATEEQARANLAQWGRRRSNLRPVSTDDPNRAQNLKHESSNRESKPLRNAMHNAYNAIRQLYRGVPQERVQLCDSGAETPEA